MVSCGSVDFQICAGSFDEILELDVFAHGLHLDKRPGPGLDGVFCRTYRVDGMRLCVFGADRVAVQQIGEVDCYWNPFNIFTLFASAVFSVSSSGILSVCSIPFAPSTHGTLKHTSECP